MKRRRAVATFLAGLVLAAANAGAFTLPALAEDPPPGPTPLGPQTPSSVALRISTIGGFTPAPVPAPPEVTVYADGQVVTLDTVIDPVPDPTADPGAVQQPVDDPALAGLTQRTLDSAALGRLLAAARAAGLADNTYNDPTEPDVAVTVITMQLDELRYTSSFTGFGARDTDSPQIADRRAGAEGFLSALRDLPALAGPDGVSAPAPLDVDRYPVSVRPARGGIDPVVKDWPAREIDLATLSRAADCSVLDGSAAVALRAALRDQDARTQWRERNLTWRVFASPLLPDQPGCPEVGA